MWAIRGRGQVRGDLAHSIQVMVLQGDSLGNEGEREPRGKERLPLSVVLNINLRGSADTGEQLEARTKGAWGWQNW